MVKRLGLNASIGSAGSAPRSSTGVHRDPCPVDTSMKRRRDEPWHITNGCIGSACEYVNQFLLIRWFHREYVDERNDTCVFGNRSQRRSPATEGEIGPGSRILCVSSLSGILCARHSMTTRSIYAKQDEDEECRYSGQVGGAAVDSEGAD